MATVVDGKARAAGLREAVAVAKAVEETARDYGVQPGLAVVLVGSDPASDVDVRNKTRQTTEAGLLSPEHQQSSSLLSVRTWGSKQQLADPHSDRW
jgi:methylenetetrahydrofolate dehydrogenase (NADP+)/methenyltetrahydrofolate cyclohydrolase